MLYELYQPKFFETFMDLMNEILCFENDEGELHEDLYEAFSDI